MELLKQIRFQALAPEKIDALIDLVDHDLGYRLYQATEKTKCVLSEQLSGGFLFKETTIEISNHVTRPQFEGWISTEVQAISNCVDRLMNRFNVTAKEVDAIFMTGGSSFVPAIRRLFEKKFGDGTPIRAGQEFTSVAEGLAIHASEILRSG